VRSSLDTAKWAGRQGVKLQPGLGRQAYQVDGKFKFWGGLALHIWGCGPELLKALYAKRGAARHPDHVRDPGGRSYPGGGTAARRDWRNTAVRR